MDHGWKRVGGSNVGKRRSPVARKGTGKNGSWKLFSFEWSITHGFHVESRGVLIDFAEKHFQRETSSWEESNLQSNLFIGDSPATFPRSTETREIRINEG